MGELTLVNDTVILERRTPWWRRRRGQPARESVICGLGRAFYYVSCGYTIDWTDTKRAHLAALQHSETSNG